MGMNQKEEEKRQINTNIIKLHKIELNRVDLKDLKVPTASLS
jgi:hypothetical protein